MTESTGDPIQHVVVLMLENRSFDQMLGIFKTSYPDMEGIDPTAAARINSDLDGNSFPQAATAETRIFPDPRHEYANVIRQLTGQLPQPVPVPARWDLLKVLRLLAAIVRIIKSWKAKKAASFEVAAEEYPRYFVVDYAISHPEATLDQRRQIMGYYDIDFLPAHHALARDFTICDHWFASVPGPTWTNRLFMHSGTSLGIVRMPEGESDVRNVDVYDQPTVYDRLNEQGVPWKIYFGDFPQSWVLLRQLEQPSIQNYSTMDDFYADVAGPASAFPAYSFIEPRYFPPDPNDDHPPHDTMAAQELLAGVYNALRAKDELWHSTLLVVLYDEHGGFFDHVIPPMADPPDNFTDEYGFDRLGVRVPALLVSPWVERGVLSTRFDHTSLLKYLTEKWKLGPLGNRVARARSIGEAIRTSGAPRTDAVERIIVPAQHRTAVTGAMNTEKSPNDLQEALFAFSGYLKKRTPEDPDQKPEMVMTTGETDALIQAEIAKHRAARFLACHKSKPS